MNSLVVEAPQIDGGVGGVAGQVVSKRVPPSSAVGGSITNENRGALALQVRLNIAGCCLNEGGGGTRGDVYDDLVTDIESENVVIFEESVDGAEIEVQQI